MKKSSEFMAIVGPPGSAKHHPPLLGNGILKCSLSVISLEVEQRVSIAVPMTR